MTGREEIVMSKTNQEVGGFFQLPLSPLIPPLLFGSFLALSDSHS